jgi:CHASE1-domain containing sensor protein
VPEPTMPYLQLTVEVSLPDSATDEQREKFRRALEELGGSPTLVIAIGLPPSATPAQRENFEKAMRERFPEAPIDTKPIDG